MSELVLAVKPAPSSVELGLYRDGMRLAAQVARHADGEPSRSRRAAVELAWRAQTARGFLDHAHVARGALAAVVGRAGALRPVHGGTYLVDDSMLRDAARAETPAGLGPALAKAIADEQGCPAFVVDPDSVDELDAAARLSGLAGLPRRSGGHALGLRGVAWQHAAAAGRPLESLRLIVARLGGETAVGALREGLLVDATSSLDDGPFSERSCGGLPAAALSELCLAPGAELRAVRRRLFGDAGLASHLGTTGAQEAADRAERGDPRALLVLDAMAYQVAKSIGGLACALTGEVDAIVVAGARSTVLVNGVCRRVEWIAPVFVYPDDDELWALAEGARRVLAGEEPARRYV